VLLVMAALLEKRLTPLSKHGGAEAALKRR
jgi:hypothetical protein